MAPNHVRGPDECGPAMPQSVLPSRAFPQEPASAHRAASGDFASSSELAARMALMALVTAPGWARSLTRSMLGHWAVPEDTIQIAMLLASELVTNAVKFATHASDLALVPRAEIIALTLTKLPDRVVIEVADPDSNPPLLADADDDAESGRGLMLVQAQPWTQM